LICCARTRSASRQSHTSIWRISMNCVTNQQRPSRSCKHSSKRIPIRQVRLKFAKQSKNYGVKTLPKSDRQTSLTYRYSRTRSRAVAVFLYNCRNCPLRPAAPLNCFSVEIAPMRLDFRRSEAEPFGYTHCSKKLAQKNNRKQVQEWKPIKKFRY